MADQVIRGLKTDRVFYVPGQHDVLTDNGHGYRDRYGKGPKATGGTAGARTTSPTIVVQ